MDQWLGRDVDSKIQRFVKPGFFFYFRQLDLNGGYLVFQCYMLSKKRISVRHYYLKRGVK